MHAANIFKPTASRWRIHVAKSEIVIKASNSGIKRTEDPLSYSYLKLILTTANRHRIYKQLLKIIFFMS